MFGLAVQVQVAIIGGLFTLLGLIATGGVKLIQLWFETRSLGEKQSQLAEDVKTNHGKRPGEYLEMVAEVKDLVAEVAGEVRFIKAEVAAFGNVLAEHTVADAQNFAVLNAQLAAATTPKVVVAPQGEGGTAVSVG